MQDDAERARECLAREMERDADAIGAGEGGKLRNEAAASVLRCNANDVRNGGGDSRVIRAMIAFAQQPEGWREALEKISTLTVTPISEDHAAANNGKEVIRAKSIARRALAPAAMLDVAPIPGEEK